MASVGALMPAPWRARRGRKLALAATPRLLTEPCLDLGRVRLDPLLGGLLGIHVLSRDHVRDRVLVRRGPLPALEDANRRRAALREFARDHLVDDREPVRASV